ncbi:histidinol-phosphate transaminase [Parashewanella curva]|uniref:Histidinol-phosphate aminotransferase n=1 Tax=Parashewanella curva TaxID=2338552 RepID=A0A3L8PSN5_9GAMM|nr:histidinol-phosphate transaminase [Parashewanella curva]RLV58405.1 histidinol-phosphate transaminase [Parashewanella curva]
MDDLNWIAQLQRPNLMDLVPYESARVIGGEAAVMINANESPFCNIEQVSLSNLNRYPEPQPLELNQSYASYAGVEINQLLCTRGADEAIELLIRTFCTPSQDSISYFAPSYGMYAISAETCGVESIALPFTDRFKLTELDATVIDSKIIFVCNPNNPTGTIVTTQSIENLLQQFPKQLIAVDEAYIEFSPANSAVELLETYPNLIILRTLSKAFALAGLRCGFLLANPEVIKLVGKVIAPYPVPVPVAEIAQQALSQAGIQLMEQQVATLIQQKKRLEAFFTFADIPFFTSYGNFILAEFSQPEDMWLRLIDNGILARRYTSPQLSRYIRFTVGAPVQTQKVIDTINAGEQA